MTVRVPDMASERRLTGPCAGYAKGETQVSGRIIQ